MARPSFSPVLVLGVGEQAGKIMQQIQAWLTKWPPSLQQLMQFLWLDSLENEPLLEHIQLKVDILKRGGLLQQAVEAGQISLRNTGGPLEIKVWLVAPLGRNKLGLSLDKILVELCKVRYAWQPSRGFTGATLTTITWLEGSSPNQRFVLQRALNLYKSEEFLDSFAGKLLVTDRIAQDGSQVEWWDYNLALARLLYLSIIPGDDPVLMPELGLIRRDERESKLGTLGLRCITACFPDGLNKLIPELDSWVQSWLEGVGLDVNETGQSVLWTEVTEQALCRSLNEAKNQLDPVHAVTTKLKALLEEDLAGKLRGQNPGGAMAYLCAVEKRLTTMYSIWQRRTSQNILPAKPVGQPIIQAEPVVYQVEEHSGSLGPALLVALLLGAVLYRLTASSIIPEKLGWILGILLFVLVFLYVKAVSTSSAWSQEVEIEPVVTKRVAEVVEEVVPQPNPEVVVCIELMLQHCRSAKQDLRKLGRALRNALSLLREQGTPMLNQRISVQAAIKSIAPKDILPAGWRELTESECTEFIMGQILQSTEQGENVAETGDALINQSGSECSELSDPAPLLMFSPSRPLRKIALLAATPQLGKRLALKYNRRLVNGEAGVLCVVNLYFGLQPEDLNLETKHEHTYSGAYQTTSAEL